MDTVLSNHSTRMLLALGLALLLLSGLALVTAPAQPARADPAIIYVDRNATGANDGTSWADAFTTLQDALEAANAGDELWVAQGVYTPTNAADRTASFSLKNGVALYGGFVGNETAREQRDWETHITVLSGDLDGNDLTDPNGIVTDTAHIVGDNAYRVVTGFFLDVTTVLDGFVITAGKADGDSAAYQNGGGMDHGFFSNATLANLVFRGNQAADKCGGLANQSASNPTLTNVTFIANQANNYGGGMCNLLGSHAVLTDVVFIGNSADYGGGMHNHNSNPSITNAVFSDNHANRNGGGLYNNNSNLSLENAAFDANHANYGGGMYNQGGSPALVNVTFSGNQTVYHGGGMGNVQSAPTLTGVTFSGNQANSRGGGLYNFESNSTLVEITFFANIATSRGGGMYNEEGSPTLTNVTFDGNQSGDFGGGMANMNSSPVLDHVVFNDNHANYSGGMRNEGGQPTLNHVTFSGNTAINLGGGMHNINSSPTLTDVAFYANVGSYGGGMLNHQSSPTLTHVIFEGNRATSHNGGGLHNHNGSAPVLRHVTFISNTAQHSGGGMSNLLSSSPTLTDVAFVGNQATRNGGGAYYSGSDHTALINVAFHGNQAGEKGGGLYHDNSSPALINVTFGGNRAGEQGGGMYNFYSHPSLINCILWGNEAPEGAELYNTNSTPIITASDVQGCGGSGGGWNPICGADGGGNLDSDPLFVAPIAASHAPTTTGNYRLRHASPAIDTGNTLSVTATTDLDGQPRVVDGNGDGAAGVDMGAYEYQAYTLAVTWVGEGSVAYMPVWPTYTYGDPVVLTATAETGWSFAGWSGDVISDANPLTHSMTGYTAITATFTQEEYTLTVHLDPAEGGAVDIAPAQASYRYGESITLTATANPEWTFAGWSGDVISDANPLTHSMTGYTAITATFTQEEYTLTVHLDPAEGGAVDIAPEKATYRYGDIITLTATANPGWTFARWSGDVTSNANPLSLTLTASTSVTATFHTSEHHIYLPLIVQSKP